MRGLAAQDPCAARLYSMMRRAGRLWRPNHPTRTILKALKALTESNAPAKRRGSGAPPAVAAGPSATSGTRRSMPLRDRDAAGSGSTLEGTPCPPLAGWLRKQTPGPGPGRATPQNRGHAWPVRPRNVTSPQPFPRSRMPAAVL